MRPEVRNLRGEPPKSDDSGDQRATFDGNPAGVPDSMSRQISRIHPVFSGIWLTLDPESAFTEARTPLSGVSARTSRQIGGYERDTDDSTAVGPFHREVPFEWALQAQSVAGGSDSRWIPA